MVDARGAQRAQVSLGVALVLAHQRFRERYVFDQAALDLLRQCQRRLAALGAAAIDVACATSLNGCARPVPRLNTPLQCGCARNHRFTATTSSTWMKSRACCPGCVAAIVAEQAHLAAVAILVEMMERYRRHPALVLLARAIDIEIAQSDHLARVVAPWVVALASIRRTTSSNSSLE
jgi:hypothetical protein